uniref:Putative amblyomma 40-33 family member n=1 Tax=Rhipicephalus pulchellus TaxID=72859 RepID=L7MBL5_RHIPC
MKHFIALLCVVAYVGHATADNRYQEAVHDLIGLLERDTSPPKGGSSSVNQANDFIDVVLLQRMPALIRETPGLFPAAPLPPHYFKVYKTSITNRDLKVNVTRGGIRNFDTAIHRVGDCIPALVAGNTSVSCTLSFDGILAELVAVTKGDNLLNIVKSVDVEALVYNTTGRLEVTAAPNRPGFVRTLFVEGVNFDVRPGSNLDLNEVRMNNFKTHIANFLREELYMNIYGNYQILLNHACARMSFALS